MPALKRIAAIIVAVLVVIGAAVVAVNLAGQPGTAVASGSASASATAEPTPGQASDGPSGSALPQEELLAALSEIEDQVEAIRGLPAANIGPPELIGRADLRQELEEMLDEEYPADERERDNRVLRALGLLSADEDIAALQLQLLGDQVLGFYDDAEQRMVVVTDVGLDTEAKITYAHEYTHALQDAAFDLDLLNADDADDDTYLALQALVEGDATLTMFAWAFDNLSQAELTQYLLGAETPDTSGIPGWMVEQLLFAYEDGLTFTSELAGSNPLTPSYGEIDSAFASPPTSTEQVIDPQAWAQHEAPVAVEGASDLAAAMGDGWTELESTTMGQAMIEIILRYLGVPDGEATTAAAGWGGDRAVIASGPDGAFAVAWQLAWDTPADGDEFAAAYRSIAGALGFPVDVVELPDGGTLVVHASSDDLARRAQESAGG